MPGIPAPRRNPAPVGAIAPMKADDARYPHRAAMGAPTMKKWLERDRKQR